MSLYIDGLLLPKYHADKASKYDFPPIDGDAGAKWKPVCVQQAAAKPPFVVTVGLRGPDPGCISPYVMLARHSAMYV